MRFLDFFSGIGGFRIGMESAGHTCVGHCEIDKYADMSYRMMHTVTDEQREYLNSMEFRKRQTEIRKEEYLNGEWYADDIRSVEPGDLPAADCYCFGFPCQAFSIAGKRRGFEDTRGTLFFEVMRLAKERNPEYLFAENVSGLLNHDGGVRSRLSSEQWMNWGTVWNGKCLTANITCPKIVKECSLSDILEDSVSERYFLSQAAVERLTSFKDSRVES